MNEITETSNKNLAKAFLIRDELQVQQTWEKIGGKCNLIGSVKMGLLMSNLDIDFHVYTDNFSIEQSFGVISQISKNPRIKEVTYKNLLDAQDMCLEWHLTYIDNTDRKWMIDIIHIKNESPYAGMMERISDRICMAINPVSRDDILRVKWEAWKQGDKVRGIDVYRAVIDNKVKNYEQFKEWKAGQEEEYISIWEPQLL
ncbi:phosphoglycerate mutase family protein [Dysgonomonas sp. 511]|uniref:phosphoglycerate mutase family protein n=1 Tax=Dysgonomonas sp. 511 TaxID=2302930 RepID=UPI0013D5C822|nr:phosphoglycerate mutase family protein [Dysgonomonas sp. 511]NDV79752.1 phosphoglycerate mutase family protein [Dysgonomonas sp. 511]